MATLNASGVKAVGLTGADATVAPVRQAPPFAAADGRKVSLGRVGIPKSVGRPSLLEQLTAGGFVPVVASVSAASGGGLFNVNADTLAGNLAARLKARRLVVAGATAGVLDASGATVPMVERGRGPRDGDGGHGQRRHDRQARGLPRRPRKPACATCGSPTGGPRRRCSRP